MSVLIENMEMPKETPVLFCAHPDGKVFADLEGGWREYKAAPVPPHGRLIDADALIAAHEQVCSRSMKFNLDLATTIIPAEPSEEQREYEAAVEAAQYCETYEPTYNPETGAM